MNQRELQQYLAGLDRIHLMNFFSSVERNYNCVYPTLERYSSLKTELGNAQSLNETNKQAVKQMPIIAAGSLAAVVVCLILRGATSFLGPFIFTVLAIFALICVVVALVNLVKYKGCVKESEAQVANLQRAVAAEEYKLNQLKQQYQSDLLIRQWVLPQECVFPRYMRLWVSYFETGRANSMADAYALFENHLHREKMEANANAQLAAALSAEQAAHAAYSAASQAAATAQQAKNSADWAAYNSRYNN